MEPEFTFSSPGFLNSLLSDRQGAPEMKGRLDYFIPKDFLLRVCEGLKRVCVPLLI